jgi:SAM-dependent methyltransferase
MVLPLTASPIADAYVGREGLTLKQDVYPLDLYLCAACGHVQNVDVVDPEVLFREYTYVTASSSGLVDHYRRYADDISSRFGAPAGSLVLEIGSNDGSLLRFFKARGHSVLGVDPARRIAALASDAGIPTLPEFFSSALADDIRSRHGTAAYIVANNVFAHADDLEDVVVGIRSLLDDAGVFIFEVSYLPDIVDRFLFDTVYHEHVSYHSLLPLASFFDRLGMQLFDVQRSSSKGGSIRGFAQRSPSAHRPVTAMVQSMIEDERRRRFTEPAVFRQFASAIAERKAALSRLLDDALSQGRSVAGYGASTTVTTLMWHFDLTEKLDFLVDDNPRKHGLFAPRCHIPVVPSEELYSRRPDIVVLLAWNYAPAIVERHGRFLSEGGTFLLPLPEVELISANGRRRAALYITGH